MKKKRFFTAILCALMIVCMMPQGVTAANVSARSLTKVTNLHKNTVTTKSINISWSGQAGISGYEVYRSKAYNGTYSKIKSIYAGNTAFCNQKLSAGTEYYYKVRAYTTKGSTTTYGEFSNILTAATKAKSAKKGAAKYNVNVRKHAGTSFGIITTMRKGTKVSILSTTQDSAGVKWYRVSFKMDNKSYKGYVRSDLIGNTSGGTATKTGTVRTSGSRLNIRSGPGTNYNVIGSANNGQKVTIYNTRTGSGMSWYYISFKVGGRTIKGYACTQYIRVN